MNRVKYIAGALLGIGIVISSLYSCTSQKEIMNSWIGKSPSQLMMSWGPAHNRTPDGQGGEIWMYGKSIYIPATQGVVVSGSNGSTYQGSGASSRTYYKITMFYVNSSGLIYHWLIQNSQVPPQQIDVNMRVRYN